MPPPEPANGPSQRPDFEEFEKFEKFARICANLRDTVHWRLQKCKNFGKKDRNKVRYFFSLLLAYECCIMGRNDSEYVLEDVR
jgi:hypothetical protein